MMKRSFIILAVALFCVAFIVPSSAYAGGGSGEPASAPESGCVIVEPIPALMSGGTSRTFKIDSAAVASTVAERRLDKRLTIKTEKKKKNPAKSTASAAIVLKKHPELLPDEEIGIEKGMSSVRGWTEYCKRADSSAGEEYCNVERGEMCWRSSSTQAYDCRRYSWDEYGEYTARATVLARYISDCDVGVGGHESLRRGRFYIGEDGSIIVRPSDGSILYFDPVVDDPCAETATDNIKRASLSREYSWYVYEVPAFSNVTHDGIDAAPWVRISDTLSSETLWEGSEVCWAK